MHKIQKIETNSRLIMLHVSSIAQGKRPTLPATAVDLLIPRAEFILGGDLGRVEIDLVVDFSGGFVEAG
jgi:hypothetical protein